MNENLAELIRQAVAAFMDERPSLLELNVHEQSISHRIAVHLERLLDDEELNVDCEYNKNLGEPKRIEIDGLDARLRQICGCHICRNMADEIERERRFRPDIIAHLRNSNEHNTVAIEIKRGVFCPFDEAKLRAMTGPGGQYRYELGAFVYFQGNNPEIIFYHQGNRVPAPAEHP